MGCHALLQRLFLTRNRTCVSCGSCIAGRFFTTKPPRNFPPASAGDMIHRLDPCALHKSLKCWADLLEGIVACRGALCTWRVRKCFTKEVTFQHLPVYVAAPVHSPRDGTKVKWRESRAIMSNSLQLHGLYSSWNSPGQNTGVGSLLFSRGSSQPRDQTQVSRTAGGFFTSWATREAQEYWRG